MDDKEKRRIEELIDASLRHYASAQPRPGLENRILAGVRTRQRAARRRTALAWGMGMATVAATVILLTIHWPREQPATLPVTAKALPSLSVPIVAKVAPPVQPHGPQHVARSVQVTRVDRRPQQFPTPRPLSEQEKLLLAYARAFKGTAVPTPDTVCEPEHDLEIPLLTVAAIKIGPLPAAGKTADQ